MYTRRFAQCWGRGRSTWPAQSVSDRTIRDASIPEEISTLGTDDETEVRKLFPRGNLLGLGRFEGRFRTTSREVKPVSCVRSEKKLIGCLIKRLEKSQIQHSKRKPAKLAGTK